MPWIIAQELPDYPNTERARIAGVQRRHLRHMLQYDECRALLEQVYPGRQIFTPLEHAPGALVVALYVSPNKEGQGRIGGNFMLWGVSRG